MTDNAKANGETEAFPGTENGSGIMLREYIAVHALQGILASGRFAGGGPFSGSHMETSAAQAAVKAADALLVALEGDTAEVSERGN